MFGIDLPADWLPSRIGPAACVAGLCAFLLLGLSLRTGLIHAHPSSPSSILPGSALPASAHTASPADTTLPRPAASSFDPEAGRFLQRFVDADAYDSGVQNFDVAQDSSGVLYVGNNRGVLVYDGHRWQTIPLPNQNGVRSLTADREGRIYVGAHQEIGRVGRDSLGRLRYVSLTHHVPDEHRTFTDVWRTEATSEGVYFQAAQHLFRWQPDTESLQSWSFGASNLAFADVVRDTLFLRKDGEGLMRMDGDSLRRVPGGDAFASATVPFILPRGDDGLLVGTGDGLVVRDGDSFRPFETEVDTLLRKARVYTGTVLPDGTIAVGTIDRGLVLIGPDGELRRYLAARGKPVPKVYYDREGGLWAALSGGLIRYDLRAPITEYGADDGLGGIIMDVEKHRGRLYVATLRSTYRQRASGDGPAAFETILDAGTGSFDLLAAGRSLLIGTQRDLYDIRPGASPRPLSDVQDTRALLRSRSDSSRIYAVSDQYAGSDEQEVVLLTQTPNGWRPKTRTEGFNAEVTALAEQGDSTLWVGASYGGVYRIRGVGTGDSTAVTYFGDEHGLPSGPIGPYRWRDEVVFGTRTGLYRFGDTPRPHFTPIDSVALPPYDANAGQGHVAVTTDRQGRVWGLAGGTPGRWVQRDSAWQWAPGLLQRIHHRDVRTLDVEDDGETIWLSTDDGTLLRYVPDDAPVPNPPPLRIRRVATADAGSLLTASGARRPPAELPYAHNGIGVAYSTPSLTQPSRIRYQYRLNGSGTGWSEWTERTEQTFRNLSPGAYTFTVRGRTAYGDTTQVARYAFTVLPPWYRTWWAYALYALGALGVVAGAVQWRTRRLRRRQEALEETVAERTEAIRQKNDRLAAQKEQLTEQKQQLTEQKRQLTEQKEQLTRQKERLAEQAEHLQELDRAKTRFFANVSHEFRTPLTLILGPVRDLRERIQAHLPTESTEASDDLSSGPLAREDAQQLSVVERNARRLLRLVDQLLGIARMEAGSYELDARPLDVHAAVRRIARSFQPLAEREELTLSVEHRAETGDESGEGSGDWPPVYVDEQAFEHMAGNLLSNAIRYTPAGGAVTIMVRERASGVEVAVADTGPGIPEDEQEAVFERFRQSGTSGDGSPGKKGAGIGLAFTRDLAELHGGSVALDSVVGEGTTVTLHFRRGTDPLDDAHIAREEAASDQLANDEPGGDGRSRSGNTDPTLNALAFDDGAFGDDASDATSISTTASGSDSGDGAGRGTGEADGSKLVLVVDDNADVRRYVRSILEPAFEVIEAGDGEAGWERARETLPDVVLADVMMPGLGGYEMTRRLKQDPDTEAIPVIMLTARAGTDDEVRGLRAGADDYVTKPFDAAVLRQRVAGVVRMQERLRRRLREEGTGGAADESEDAASETASGERSEIEVRARSVIREHLTEPDFDVDALAEAMAMSRSTLYRRFNASVSESPAELITTVRMEEAERLLREGKGNVTQVAYAVGYERLGTFSHAFRKHAGRPPSEVRG